MNELSLLEAITQRASSHWTLEPAPKGPVVVSSRIRLARNVEHLVMPQFQNEDQSQNVLRLIREAADPILQTEGLTFYKIGDMDPLDRQILVEKHLISPEHAQDQSRRAVLISGDEKDCVMINEEDHLRIQTFFPGLQLDQALNRANVLDDLLERNLPYAFDEKKGYLTACPTNLGTGMRASVMLHLPAMDMTQQTPMIFQTLFQVGLVVRGLFGEGSEAVGHFYQISNRTSTGIREFEMIQHLSLVTDQIVEKEMATRRKLKLEAPLRMKDRCGRSYGILQNAAILSTKEALEKLSDVLLGKNMGFFSDEEIAGGLVEYLISAQPGFIQKQNTKKMNEEERDVVRADLFRKICKRRFCDV
jgi:protein arginine kinase